MGAVVADPGPCEVLRWVEVTKYHDGCGLGFRWPGFRWLGRVSNWLVLVGPAAAGTKVEVGVGVEDLS